ncbi:MAG: DUF2142 domain-containing protein [Betaproteobacteria bacterium]|nr:DUF2142 domain-containing protein [Betaproteobacteria bacterium]
MSGIVVTHERLHWLILALLAPLLGLSLLLTAPFQTPDEFAHFLRAAQLSELDFRSLSGPDGAGGMIRSGYQRAVAEPEFNNLSFHPERQLNQAEFLRHDLWKQAVGAQREYVAYANTAYYPSLNYVLPALGLGLNTRLGGGAMTGLYAGRLATALGVTLILFLSLRHITRGKVFCLTLLAMPMSIALMGAISQDAALIAYTLAAVALGNRYLDAPDSPRAPLHLAGMGLLLLPVVLGRPPYAPLLLIPLLLARDPRERRAAGLVLIFSLVWLAVWFQWMKGGPQCPTPGVAPALQWRHVLEHPLFSTAAVVLMTLVQLPAYAQQFVGRLGWLDTALPLYVILGFLLALFWLFRRDRPVQGWTPAQRGIAFLILCVPFLIALAQYLYWTPVGEFDVDGVQGRYYIPPVLLLSLLLRPAGADDAHGLPWAVIAFLALANFHALYLVAARFWA